MSQEGAGRDSDLLFGLAVDRMLSQRAAERAAGVAPTAWIAEPAAPPPGARTGEIRTDPDGETSNGQITTTFHVAGMTCRSCEVRIQKFVGRLSNVQHVAASAVHGRVEVVSSRPVSAAAVERAINAAGYEIGRTPWLASDPAIWITAGAGVLLVVALAFAAQLAGLSELASGVGDLSKGGIVVALLLGLAAGISTCMALVGGLVLALSAAFRATRSVPGEAVPGFGAQMRPALVFMAGRVAGYGLFGAALGAVGAGVALPPQLTAVLMIAVAIVMTLLGTRLTGVSPRIATWSPTLPMGLGQRLGLGGDGQGAYSDERAAALGAASFFLPCGFTQAVQIFALSTGSPLFGGALLATFAIGTAPGILALAGLPAVVPSNVRPTLLRLVGVAVLGFALVNGSAGFRLAGIALPSFGASPVSAAGLPPAGSVVNGKQALHTYQKVNGYSPVNVAIYAGVPTTWTIESTSTIGCASALVVPSLNISKRLKLGANIINLPALSAGTLSYSCAMGMFGGQITIVDPPKPPVKGSANGG